MRRLILLQHADGHWQLDEHLAAILGVTLTDIPPSTLPDEAWATVLALAFLQTTCQAYKEEYELVEIKARHYLNTKANDQAHEDAKAFVRQNTHS